MILKEKAKEYLSLYLCRHKNVQDFFVAREDEISLDGFDEKTREFFDIDNQKDFEKICRQFNFSVPDANIKERFEQKAHFCLLTENGQYGCWGWYMTESEKFYLLEIDRYAKIPENTAVLFHYYTNPDLRLRGLYFDLLRNVTKKNGKKYSVIYAYDTNSASSNAMKKAGYKFAGRYGHKSFTNFEELINRTKV